MEKNLNLDIFHSTWAMERRHPKLPEWSLAEQCEMVASAGFQGFNIDPETPFIPDVKSCRAALANAGLGCSICAFPEQRGIFSSLLEDKAPLDRYGYDPATPETD